MCILSMLGRFSLLQLFGSRMLFLLSLCNKMMSSCALVEVDIPVHVYVAARFQTIQLDYKLVDWI